LNNNSSNEKTNARIVVELKHSLFVPQGHVLKENFPTFLKQPLLQWPFIPEIIL